jgi:hypothetical protein
MNRGKPLIQILATKGESGPRGNAVAVARGHVQGIASIGAAQGCEAVLVCPAPELEGDNVELIVAVRFSPELDPDTVFWRQRGLARELYHALRVEALVVDLDGPLGFLELIEPMLAVPYRDEIGRRCGTFRAS